MAVKKKIKPLKLNKKKLPDIVMILLIPWLAIRLGMACLSLKAMKIRKAAVDRKNEMFRIKWNTERLSESDGHKDVLVRYIVSCYAGWTDSQVDTRRKQFEALALGKKVIKTNPNRRLYCVLKPTRKENIKRIANTLRAMEVHKMSKYVEASSNVKI